MALGVASVVLVAVFLLVERGVSEPILPLRLFRIGVFNVAGRASFIVDAAMFGANSFLPLFLQVVNGASATSSWLSLVPVMVGLLSASILAGAPSPRRPVPCVPRRGHRRGRGSALPALHYGTRDDHGGGQRLHGGARGRQPGLVMQVLVLTTQNSVPITDLGIAT